MVIFYVFLEVELYRNANDGILLYLTFEEVCYFPNDAILLYLTFEEVCYIQTWFLTMHHKPRLNLLSDLLWYLHDRKKRIYLFRIVQDSVSLFPFFLLRVALC